MAGILVIGGVTAVSYKILYRQALEKVAGKVKA